MAPAASHAGLSVACRWFDSGPVMSCQRALQQVRQWRRANPIAAKYRSCEYERHALKLPLGESALDACTIFVAIEVATGHHAEVTTLGTRTRVE